MGRRESTANFQLLADDCVIALADDLQPIDTARRTSGQRFNRPHRAERETGLRADEIGEFATTVRDAPAVEIASFLIEGRQNALQQFAIAAVAIGRWTGAYPFFGTARRPRRSIVEHGLEIRNVLVLPRGGVALGDTAAAF